MPGGSWATLRYLTDEELVEFAADVDVLHRALRRGDLGGLLLAVNRERAPALLRELEREGAPAAAVIGEVVAEHLNVVRVLRAG